MINKKIPNQIRASDGGAMSSAGEHGRGGQKKGKTGPKEQRKARPARPPRPPRPPADLPPDNNIDVQKAPENPEKTAELVPGPEFCANLKRETDEILKITEAENAKYRSKTIQNNWKKYELPIESYEEREELENLGADYQQLINAPISSGGHFQFKHEKSWNTTTKSSEYDKYFNIDMKKLNLALSTIPFYQRNNLDINMFTDGDIKSMEYRAKKFKHKYCEENSKPNEDASIDCTDKLLATLKQSLKSSVPDAVDVDKEDDLDNTAKADIVFTRTPQEFNKIETDIAEDKLSNTLQEPVIVKSENIFRESLNDEFDILLGEKEISANVKEVIVGDENGGSRADPTAKGPAVLMTDAQKKTILEPKEDLEQWLDDFLDS